MESARRARRGIIAGLTVILMTVGAALMAPIAAVAAPSSGATLNWNIKAQFSDYVLGGIAHGSISADGDVTATGTAFAWAGGAGDADTAAVTADVDFTGGIRFLGHDGELDVTISDPNVVITSATTGAVYAHVVSPGYAAFQPIDATIKVVDLTFSSLTVTPTSISGTSATQAFTAEARGVFGNMYTDADPVSFTIPAEQVATATTTGLAVDPAAGTADAGTAITLTATVAPSTAAGTVQFFSSAGVALGAPQTVSGGVASITTSDLPAGAYAFSAAFTPTDSAAFTASASGESAFTVTTPVTAVATTTATPTTSPAAPVLLGTSTTVATTVTASDSSIPVGTVEFFRVPAGVGATPVSIGTSPVSATGTASVAVALPAGGQTFSARFTPTVLADFQASASATTTANYGVVDTAAPAACTVPSGTAVSSTSATASWNVSTTVATWAGPITRSASGNISVSGTVFSLSGGSVTATADCARIAFTGAITLDLYHGLPMSGNPTVVLANPTLVIDAAGNGVWIADVTVTSASTNSGPTTMAVASFSTSGVSPAATPGAANALTVAFDWTGATAPGTWSVGGSVAQTASWRNAFVWALPANIRAHFHASGSGSDANKRPGALTVSFDWPAVTTLALAATPASPAVAGSQVALTATVTPATATGSVEFFGTVSGGTETSLGSVAVSGGVATLSTSALAGGAHTFRAEFTSEVFESSSATAGTSAAPYRVVDTAQPAQCTVTGDAEQLTGVEIDWDWNAYSADWLKFLDGAAIEGETFELVDGVATLGEDCLVVDFETTLRVEAYNDFFPTNGQWIELVDPSLVLDADGNGAWVAGVRTGIATLNTNTPVRTVVAEITGADVPDFAGDSESASIALDYAGTTARGTWSGTMSDNRTGAWSNAFVLQIPSAIRSFYFQSGAGRDGDKPAAPLQLSWNLQDPTVSASAAEVERGKPVTFLGSGFRAGETVTATVFSDPVDLGEQTATVFGTVAYTWTVPADFELGVHTVVLETEDGRTAEFEFSVTAVPAAGEDVCIARAVDGGSLTWGVRTSFREYILGPIANGSITFQGSPTTASSYTWGGATGSINVKDSVGRASWGGTLAFSGHDGKLDLRIANPRVQIASPTTAYLIATVYATNSTGAVVVDSQISLAQIALPAGAISGDTVSVSGASTTLTGAGAQAFGGFYPAGSALDPISFSLALGGDVPCDDYSDPTKLAATGSTGPQLDAIWLGALLLALGAGAVVLRRRRRTV